MILPKSILRKYISFFVLFIALPVFVSNMIINKVYTDILLKNVSIRILQAIEQMSVGVDNELRRVYLTAATIANDNDIIELLTDYNRSDSPEQQFEISKDIDKRLGNLMDYSNDIRSVTFFFKKKGVYYFNKNSIGVLNVAKENEIRRSVWYNNTVHNPERASIIGNSSNLLGFIRDKYLLSLSIGTTIFSTRNEVEVINFAFTTKFIESLYKDLKYNSLGDVLFLDSEGRVVIAKDTQQIGRKLNDNAYLKRAFDVPGKSFVEEVNGKSVLITAYVLEKTGWKIVNITDYETLTGDITQVRKVETWIWVLIISLFFIFSLLFFRGIVSPINHLIGKMKRVEKGDLDTNLDVRDHTGEIHLLGRTFNKMMLQIKNLIMERDLKEKERSQAELEALHSQINPHFVSNTLNSIRLMAMIAKADSVRQMLDAFMRLLNTTFNIHNKHTNVKAEIENLENYIYIMKIRYGNKFDVDIKVDENIMEYDILKLLLQPILENSILHGLSEVEENGQIRIAGYEREGNLIFEIRDNGTGMTPDEITKLLNSDQSSRKDFNGMGVMNVNKRIKLNYGEKYGIRIESVYGEYSNVILCLPIAADETGSDRNV